MGRHRPDDDAADLPAAPPPTTGAPHPAASARQVVDRELLEHLDLLRARVDRYLVWLQITLALTNLIAAGALITNRAGLSPAMLFLQVIAPLPLWAIVPAAVALLLALGAIGYRTQPLAHVLGMIMWLTLTVGAVTGLVAATTTSPSGSLLLTALLVGVAGWHTGALIFRRRLARLDR